MIVKRLGACRPAPAAPAERGDRRGALLTSEAICAIAIFSTRYLMIRSCCHARLSAPCKSPVKVQTNHRCRGSSRARQSSTSDDAAVTVVSARVSRNPIRVSVTGQKGPSRFPSAAAGKQQGGKRVGQGCYAEFLHCCTISIYFHNSLIAPPPCCRRADHGFAEAAALPLTLCTPPLPQPCRPLSSQPAGPLC